MSAADKKALLKMLDNLREAIQKEDWSRLETLSRNMCIKAHYLGEDTITCVLCGGLRTDCKSKVCTENRRNERSDKE